MLELEQPNFLDKVSLSHSLKYVIPPTMYPHKPETYVLVSQQVCLTDWHVDCPASAVYHHVLRGVKELASVEPKARNKQLFSENLEEPR